MKKIGVAVLTAATIIGAGLAFRNFVDRWFCSESEAKKAGFKLSTACGMGTNRTPVPEKKKEFRGD